MILYTTTIDRSHPMAIESDDVMYLAYNSPEAGSGNLLLLQSLRHRFFGDWKNSQEKPLSTPDLQRRYRSSTFCSKPEMTLSVLQL